MGLFDRLFSRKPETTVGQNVWNPRDRLLDEDLHSAFEDTMRDGTAESWHRLYSLLSKSTYCVLSSSKDGGFKITATQNERGELVMVTFSDPTAIKRWKPDAPGFVAMTSQNAFQIMLENGFTELSINPAGPVGCKLSRAEVECLSRGEMPVRP
ncbi:MAG: SseB family protein [Planctomycetota bacterium]